MSNKAVGTAFENEFAEILFQNGFWAHKIQDNHNGQPFDVIAAKNGETFVFDCKDCAGYYFFLRRMEENQKNAMQLWIECGNKNALFAVRYSDDLLGSETYLFDFLFLMDLLKHGENHITRGNASRCGISLEEFLEEHL